MRNDDHLGGFENLAKGCNKFAFCCAIQKLSPVGGPPCGSPGLPTSRPAHPRLRRGLGRTTFTLPLGRAFAAPEPSRSEPKLPRLVKAVTLVSSPVYAGLTIKP
jgi:hypothetical protein